ncbi:gibberellin-regulated protein 14-like [Syngnathus acus]|uniref:gibberellin-regulated protein 14-like n=1 Tax=Syngnathus acus TaxID=161584 RepID=UPI001885CB48|nr:gibberellin-regulated protein 14-like [Syngnathus acus]
MPYICKRPASPTITTAKPVTCPAPALCPTTTTAKPATCPTPAPCPICPATTKPATCPAPAPTTAKPATCPTVTCPTPAPTTAKPATCPTPAPCPTTTPAQPVTCPTPAPCPTTTPAKPVTCPTPAPTTAKPATCPTPAPCPTTAKPATCPIPAPCPTTTPAKPVTCPTPAPTTVKPATCPTPAPCPTTTAKPATSPAGPPPTDGELEMCAISTNDKACSSHNVTCSCLLAMIANPMGGFQGVLDGLSVARSIVIRGQSNAKAKKLVVNLDARDANSKNVTAALHLNMDLVSQTFTLNSRVDRKWGDSRPGTFPDGRPFGSRSPLQDCHQVRRDGNFHLDFNDELQQDFAGPQLISGASTGWRCGK